MSENLTVPVADAPAAVEPAASGISDAATNTSLPGANQTPGNKSESNAQTQTSDKADPTPPQQTPSDSKQKTDSPEPKADQADKEQPIQDWSKVKIEVPEGTPIDDKTLGDFGKTAVKLGLTQTQAQELVKFQVSAIQRQREAIIDHGVKTLQRDWGAKASEYQQSVMTLIANIDRQMGNNAFSKALNSCGATCFPDVCKGLLLIAQSVSEDTMGKGGAGNASNRPETALDGLEAEWAKNRGKRL
ncbi:MAG: hypothetical protein IJU79_02325 [Desulfovibrionaceae bacterium]|nr:hypothetical protein [Desulfovibrionaceae bacterium]